MNENYWIVATDDGRFLRSDGDLAAEYPDACCYGSERMARSAMHHAGLAGRAQVLSDVEYAEGAL